MNKVYFRYCWTCGGVIPVANNYRNPKYCSRGCYLHEHRAKYADFECPQCGDTFHKNVKSKTKFCCNGCRWEAATNIGHTYIAGNGYVYIKTAKKYYELEHRVIMSKKLGRPLKENEHVHHKDEIKTNNDPDNLQLFDSNSSHVKYHNNLWLGGHPKDSPESVAKRVASRRRNRNERERILQK